VLDACVGAGESLQRPVDGERRRQCFHEPHSGAHPRRTR
jgi:hypothetical protein